MPTPVLELSDLDPREVSKLLSHYGVRLIQWPAAAPIPGSYWGPPEAGLIGDSLHVRGDTPVHSLLHELAHYVCMTAARRARLDIDAGGDYGEECAVCYLQVLLSDGLRGFGRCRCLDDMDAWGYSFREGSARAWLEGDAAEAREWLMERGLIDAGWRPTWALR